MSGTQIILLLLAFFLALTIIWNVLQSRRIDGHQKRIEALEKKP